MLGNLYENQDCALAATLEVVGERWTLLVVRDAFYGVQRFSEFQVHLDIPKAVLADRLAGLVDRQVLERLADPEHPSRHIYRLTSAGRELWPVVHAMVVWGDRHCHRSRRWFGHADCGTELDAAARCPACGVTPPPEDVEIRPSAEHPSSRTDPVALQLGAPHRLLQPLF